MAKKIVRKLSKGDVVRDLSEVIRVFNSTRAAKNFKFKALLLARTPEEEACMKQVKFVLNEGSYTDMKGKIVVSLHDNMIGYTLGKVMVIVLGELYHEVGHVLFTSNEEWNKFIKDFTERFEAKGINKNVAALFGKNIINSIEDGREECCITKEYNITKNPIATMRSWWWKSNDLSTHEPDELSDNLFCFASLASMGWMPKGYAELYQDENPELYDMWINLKPLINQYVVTEDHSEAMPYLWEIIDVLEDWLIQLMKKYPDPEELQKLMEGMTPPTGSTSGIPSGGSTGSRKGAGASPKSAGSKGSKKSEEEKDEEDKSSEDGDGDGSPEAENPVHDFFNNDDDSNSLIGDIDNGVEIDADESMDSIVNRAIKEADKIIEDEDFDNIVQADFDDKKNELDDPTKSDLNDSDVNELEKFYDTLGSDKRDGNWGIKLKYHHYSDAIQPTPEKIRINARPLHNAFKKLLNNKNADVIQDRKAGQLNLHKLYRIANNDTRLFQKKTVPNDTDFVFYLLIDGSGSMGHDKFVEAYRAAALLEEGLKGLVPLKIAQFDCDNYVHHRVVKEFNQNSKAGNYSWTYCNHHRAESCNMDGYNIRVAIKELEKRMERNKVLVILSDGQPSGYSCYYGQKAERDVKEAVREGRRKGIKIFNIMFGSAYDRSSLKEDFKYMYERGIVSTDPSNIGTELLKIARHELF